jgi:hypothetical protein
LRHFVEKNGEMVEHNTFFGATEQPTGIFGRALQWWSDRNKYACMTHSKSKCAKCAWYVGGEFPCRSNDVYDWTKDVENVKRKLITNEMKSALSLISIALSTGEKDVEETQSVPDFQLSARDENFVRGLAVLDKTHKEKSATSAKSN